MKNKLEGLWRYNHNVSNHEGDVKQLTRKLAEARSALVAAKAERAAYITSNGENDPRGERHLRGAK